MLARVFIIITVGNYVQCKCPTLWGGKIEYNRKCTILQPQRRAFKDYLKTVGVRDLLHICMEVEGNLPQC